MIWLSVHHSTLSLESAERSTSISVVLRFVVVIIIIIIIFIIIVIVIAYNMFDILIN